MAKKANNKLVVLEQSKTGRNTKFMDTKTKEVFTPTGIKREKKNGAYVKYVDYIFNGQITIKSKPNGNKNDNLG